MIQALTHNWAKIAISGAVALMLLILPGQAFAQANIDDCLKTGSNLELGSDCTKTDVSEGATTINSTIETVINIFSVIVGVVAVIMLIFGGFRYVTSGGDSGNIGNAKNTILYAIVGLVIVAISQAVVQFVLGEV
jgi:Type IV secretion system pilin